MAARAGRRDNGIGVNIWLTTTGSVALAGTAALAAASYLNAKLQLAKDLSYLSLYPIGLRAFEQRVKRKRISNFCVLEEYALNPKFANEIFLIFEDKKWTFKETYDITLRYAGWLHSTHGLVSGEIVALDFTNSPQYVFLILALWALGASPALINYNLTSKPLIHSVKVSTARLFIVDPDVAAKALTDETKEAFLAPNFRNNAFPLEIVTLDVGLQSSLNYFPPYRIPDNIQSQITPATIACLIYTSGTTGMPKAAVKTWANVSNGSFLGAKFLGLQPVNSRHPDRYYTCMPLYHTMAFSLGFNVCLVAGTTFVIGRKFSVSRFWTDVRESDATIIQYVGETLRYLVTSKPSPQDRDHKVRMAFGNGLRPDIWKKFKARFGIDTIIEIYGMTEGVSATWNINRNDYSDGSIGTQGKLLQLLNRKVQVIVQVDMETEQPLRDPKTGLCIPIPKGQDLPGELLFRLEEATLKERFKGYLNNPEATDKKLLRDVLDKGDIYFRTGDSIRMDKEGRLFFSDRLGDTYRWKSENVSTAEVGEVFAHHPALHEANVYGVSVPQHEGRAGCAAVLVKDNALEGGSGSMTLKPDVLEGLAAYASNSLPKYAVPLFLRIVKELPLTGNNKYQKVGLRNQGVDVQAIKQAGSSDKIYWLKPGEARYVEFTESDFQALEKGQVKL